MNSSPESWDHYKIHIVDSLKRLSDDVNSIDNKMDSLKSQSAKDLAELKMDVSNLKMRSSFWGALTGAVAAIGATMGIKFLGH